METETVTPIGTAYAERLAAFDAAQAALAATSTTDLLRTAYRLTHQMHAMAGDAYSRSARQQRDMIDAELIRRAGA